jgi:SanA protein
LIACLPLFCRLWVHVAAQGRIYESVADAPNSSVALVLGAMVGPDGRLSPILRNRVQTAVDLYKAGKVQKLLMSGDNRFVNYNEPQRMMEYAAVHGVPEKDIAMDYAGRRTYDSIYRAKHIFGLKQFIVVTQAFHLDRAIFLCNELGVDGRGVVAPMAPDARAPIREFLASVAAMFDAYIVHPMPVMGKREKIEGIGDRE